MQKSGQCQLLYPKPQNNILFKCFLLVYKPKLFSLLSQRSKSTAAWTQHQYRLSRAASHVNATGLVQTGREKGGQFDFSSPHLLWHCHRPKPAGQSFSNAPLNTTIIYNSKLLHCLLKTVDRSNCGVVEILHLSVFTKQLNGMHVICQTKLHDMLTLNVIIML